MNSKERRCLDEINRIDRIERAKTLDTDLYGFRMINTESPEVLKSFKNHNLSVNSSLRRKSSRGECAKLKSVSKKINNKAIQSNTFCTFSSVLW